MTVALCIREGGVSKTPCIAVLESSSSYFIACITVRAAAVLGLRPPGQSARRSGTFLTSGRSPVRWRVKEHSLPTSAYYSRSSTTEFIIRRRDHNNHVSLGTSFITNNREKSHKLPERKEEEGRGRGGGGGGKLGALALYLTSCPSLPYLTMT